MQTVFGDVPAGVPFRFPGDSRVWVADPDRYAHTLESDGETRAWQDLVLFEEPVELADGDVQFESRPPEVPAAWPCSG